MDAYAGEIGEAEYQSGQALRQMVMTQAEGEWLDVWAGLYGVPRLPSEMDVALQQRIPHEVFRLRVNGLAIESAIKDLTGKTVEIREPWRLMYSMKLSASCRRTLASLRRGAASSLAYRPELNALALLVPSWRLI
jgi:hypothetical protein